MAGGSTLQQPVGLLFWWTTTAILGLLTLANICRHVYRFATRLPRRARGQSDKAEGTPEDLENGKPGGLRLSSPVRCWSAIWTGMEKWLFLNSIPAPRFSWSTAKRDIPLMEILWSAGYAAGCFTLALYGTKWTIPTIANQAGWITAAQIPLIIALSQKNNLVSFLTGIRTERFAFLHRAAGRTCLLCVWLHTGCHLWLSKGFRMTMWHSPLYLWGAIGIMAYTLLLITSFRIVRQKLYEFFLVTHICLAAATIAGFMMHWSAMRIWLYPGVGLWAGDRFLRIVRLIINNRLKSPKIAFDAHQIPSHATLSLLTPSTLKLTFPALRLPWRAGQHFYVVVPGMSTFPWEAHPFTPCTIPQSGELSFLVRVRDGFTGRMKHRLEAASSSPGLDMIAGMRITAAVEGPYGVARDLSRFDGIVLIAGGSGISFAIGHLLQIIEAKSGRSQVRNARIVWMVKSKSHLQWIVPFLQLHAQSIPADLNVAIHVYVTRQVLQVLDCTAPSSKTAVMDRADSWANWNTQVTGERQAKRARTTSEKWGISWGEKRRSLQEDEAAAFRAAKSHEPVVGILKASQAYPATSDTPSENDLFGRSYTPITRTGQHLLNMPSLSPNDSTAPSQPPSGGSSQQSLDSSSQPKATASSRKVAFADQPDFSKPPTMPPRRPSAYPTNSLSRGDIIQSSPLPAWQMAPLYTVGNPNKRKDPPQYYAAPLDSDDDIPVLDFSAPFDHPIAPLDRKPSVKSVGSAHSIESIYSEHSYDPAFVAGPSYTPPSVSIEKLNAQEAYSELEHQLHFHEGRADLRAVIEDARHEVGSGRLSVNVCGPASLLRGARRAVREVSTMKSAWRGEGTIDFHAETFGW